jgi:hypothetical protein
MLEWSAKPGDGLRAERQEGEEVDEGCERVVAGGDGAVQLGLQHVGLNDVGDFGALAPGQREEVIPLRVLVADEAPVDAGQKVEGVDVGAGEVNEADPAEPVLLIGLDRREGADGSADQ